MRTRTLALVLTGIIISASGLSVATAPSASGQTAQRQLPPPPPPELPSVREYSLPPGDTQTPANNTVQGPIEENGSPPRAATDPDDTQPSARPIIRPVPVAPSPKTGADIVTGNPKQSAPVKNTRPPSTTTAPPLGRSPDSVTQAQGDTSPDTNQPQPDVITDQSGPVLSSDQPVPDAVPEAASSAVAPQEASGLNSAYYYGGGIVLLLLAGLGAYFWRRKTSASLPEEEVIDDPVPAPVPVPVSRKPAPKVFSPPNPAEPKKPSPVSSDGFVTSRIGAAPNRQSAPATIPLPTPQSAPTPLQGITIPSGAGHLQIEFIANGASSTLLNAVLNYTVKLTNISDQDLHNIRLSGAMMQADTQSAGNASQSGEVLHTTESLSAGETVTLTGDIRVPLSAIRPIAFKSQALFIPLARFGTEYLDNKDEAHQQSSAFIVGREYEPPRAKMAPFRLDLGPRSYSPVGQRPLLTG